MSILIRGMEMPKACIECPFRVSRYDTYFCRVWDALGEIKRAEFGGINKRLDDCPLIDLPRHGGLIDANRLIDVGLHLIFTSKNDDIANGVKWLWQYVLEAPVVVEAEEAGIDG